jgi:hypothetical protein
MNISVRELIQEFKSKLGFFHTAPAGLTAVQGEIGIVEPSGSDTSSLTSIRMSVDFTSGTGSPGDADHPPLSLMEVDSDLDILVPTATGPSADFQGIGDTPFTAGPPSSFGSLLLVSQTPAMVT